MKNRLFNVVMAGEREATVYLYGYFGESDWDDITPVQVVSEIDALDVDVINIRIHSPGGSVFGADTIYNALARHPATVNTFNDGMAASMGSLVFQAGGKKGKRSMAENAIYMIHNAWGVTVGEKKDMRKYADLLETLDAQALTVYEKASDLDAETLRAMMDDETYMTAEEALHYGFIDEVTSAFDDTEQMKFDSTVLQNCRIPSAVAQRFIKPAAQPAALSEEIEMPEQVATPEAVKTEAAQTPPVIDTQAAINEALASDRKRVSDIRAVFAKHDGFDAVMNKAMDEGKTAEQAAMMLVQALGEDTAPTGSHIEVGADRSREGLSVAMEIRAGFRKRETGNEQYNHMTAMQIGEACVNMSGRSTAGMRPMEIAQAATHSTSDFSGILADSCNKSVLRGWEELEDSSYSQFTSTGTVSDFKIATRAGLQSFSDLEAVEEGGEYTYGTMGENTAQVAVSKFGKKISFTWEAMINDDLGEFMKTAAKMGAAARRKESQLVYGVLSGNPKLSDNKTLFHADHGNLITPVSAPTEAALEVILTAMSTQKRRKVDIYVEPAFYVGPAKYQFGVNRLLQSAARVGASNDEINALQGIVSPIHTNRLSGDAWYILGGNGDTIEVTHLAGYETPEVMESNTADIDGIEYKVRHVCAATPLDYVGIFKNAGS